MRNFTLDLIEDVLDLIDEELDEVERDSFVTNKANVPIKKKVIVGVDTKGETKIPEKSILS